MLGEAKSHISGQERGPNGRSQRLKGPTAGAGDSWGGGS